MSAAIDWIPIAPIPSSAADQSHWTFAPSIAPLAPFRSYFDAVSGEQTSEQELSALKLGLSGVLPAEAAPGTGPSSFDKTSRKVTLGGNMYAKPRVKTTPDNSHTLPGPNSSTSIGHKFVGVPRASRTKRTQRINDLPKDTPGKSGSSSRSTAAAEAAAPAQPAPEETLGGAKVAAAGLNLLASLLGGAGAPADSESAASASGAGSGSGGAGAGALPELNLFPESVTAGTGDADEEGAVIIMDAGERKTMAAMVASLGFDDDAEVGRDATAGGAGPEAGEEGGEDDLLALMDSAGGM